jgi:hypothetical protein
VQDQNRVENSPEVKPGNGFIVRHKDEPFNLYLKSTSIAFAQDKVACNICITSDTAIPRN